MQEINFELMPYGRNLIITKNMKNFKLVLNHALLVIAITTLIIGCKKSSQAPVNSSASTETNVAVETDNSANKWVASTGLRVYYDNGGTDYGCNSSGGNCLDDVIVTPTFVAFIDVIENGSASQVATFVSNNYSTLDDVIPTDVLDDVLDTDDTVTTHGTLNTFGEGTIYIIFNDIDGLQCVCPIVF
jgi:hypothetical protein